MPDTALQRLQQPSHSDQRLGGGITGGSAPFFLSLSSLFDATIVAPPSKLSTVAILTENKFSALSPKRGQCSCIVFGGSYLSSLTISLQAKKLAPRKIASTTKIPSRVRKRNNCGLKGNGGKRFASFFPVGATSSSLRRLAVSPGGFTPLSASLIGAGELGNTGREGRSPQKTCRSNWDRKMTPTTLAARCWWQSHTRTMRL